MCLYESQLIYICLQIAAVCIINRKQHKDVNIGQQNTENVHLLSV